MRETRFKKQVATTRRRMILEPRDIARVVQMVDGICYPKRMAFKEIIEILKSEGVNIHYNTLRLAYWRGKGYDSRQNAGESERNMTDYIEKKVSEYLALGVKIEDLPADFELPAEPMVKKTVHQAEFYPTSKPKSEMSEPSEIETKTVDEDVDDDDEVYIMPKAKVEEQPTKPVAPIVRGKDKPTAPPTKVDDFDMTKYEI